MAAASGLELEPRIISGVASSEIYHDKSLPVELGSRLCFLSWIDTSGPDDTRSVFIAYYNPTIESQRAGGAIELNSRLVHFGSLTEDELVIITPSSGKSTGLIEDVQINTSALLDREVHRMIFTRGKPDSAQIKAKSNQPGSISEIYSPITARGEERIMVVDPEEVVRLIKHFQQGRKIFVLDDVFSTGSTIAAIMNILEKVHLEAGLGEFEAPPVLTVMRECVLQKNGDLDIKKIPYNLYTAVITPVVIKSKVVES